MKFFFNFCRNKGNIIDSIDKELKILNATVLFFSNKKNVRDLREESDLFFSLETNFTKSISLIVNDKSYYKQPYYWNEGFSIIMELKKIFALFYSYYNKSIAFENKNINCSLLNNQQKIFNNMRRFFEIFLNKRDYAGEIIKNNEYEINIYQEKYLKILNNDILLKPDFLKQIEVFRVFEKINERNEKIQNLMLKLMAVTNL